MVNTELDQKILWIFELDTFKQPNPKFKFLGNFLQTLPTLLYHAPSSLFILLSPSTPRCNHHHHYCGQHYCHCPCHCSCYQLFFFGEKKKNSFFFFSLKLKNFPYGNSKAVTGTRQIPLFEICITVFTIIDDWPPSII